MRYSHLVVAALVVAALAVATAGALPAQGRGSVSADLGLGGGAGYSNASYRESDGQLAAELTLTFRRNPERRLSQLWALSVGAYGSFCLLPCGELLELNQGVRVQGGATPAMLCFSGPDGGPCPPKFPDFTHIAALGGVERQGAVTLRALAGPAFYGVTHGASAAGAEARVDGASGFSHVQLMIWGATSQVYRFDGERFTLTSFGLGLRIQ